MRLSLYAVVINASLKENEICFLKSEVMNLLQLKELSEGQAQ